MPGRHERHTAATAAFRVVLIGVGVLVCAGIAGTLALTLIVFLLSTP